MLSCTRAIPLLVGLVAATLLAGCGKPPQPLPPPEPPTVGTVNPTMRPYSPVKDYTGRLATKDPVKVQPQVSGNLLKRRFTDGDVVEKDKTLLFEIDPVLFDVDFKKAKADVQKADAEIKKSTADITLAKLNLDRIVRQLAGGSGSPSDKDNAQAQLDVTTAQLELAKATKLASESAVLKAEQNLKYCKIYAPATGVIGQAKVAENALVTAFQTVLAEVFPPDPIYAYWEVDELSSLWFRDQIKGGKVDNPRDRKLKVWVMLKNETTFTRESIIDYVDIEIVRGTGTRTIRASFPNPELKTTGPDGKPTGLRDLSPGDSVRVRVEAGAAKPVLMVPETAVFAQQRKRYVYVVDAESKAQLREVEPGASDGGFIEVNRKSASNPSGLDESDKVIVDNLLRIRPGVPVKVK